MQEAEHVAIGLERISRTKVAIAGLTSVSEGLAQEQAGWKALVGAAQHAAGVMGLDQALDTDGEVGDRPVGEHMRDVAERILMHVEA